MVDAYEFEQFIAQQRPRYLRVALQILKHEEDAEDAVQDAILNALRHLHEFEGRAKLSSWFHRVVVNAAFMRGRKRDRMLFYESALDARDSKIARNIPDPTWVDPGAQIDMDRMLAAIDRLPPSFRRPLRLALDGLSHNEGARTLGIAAGTYKSNLSRGRKQMRKMLRAAA